MKEDRQLDILSDFDKELVSKEWIKKIVILQFITFFVVLLLRIVCDFMPRNFYDTDSVTFSTFGSMVLVLYVVNALIIPKILNQALPRMSIVTINVISFSCLFVVTVSFKLVNYFGRGYELDSLDLQGLLKASLLTAIFAGFLVTNIRIHRLRKKRTLIPVFLFFIMIILIGYLLRLL